MRSEYPGSECFAEIDKTSCMGRSRCSKRQGHATFPKKLFQTVEESYGAPETYRDR